MESFNNLLEALVITLREGIEAALVVGIVLACLTRLGRPELRRAVWTGVLAAVVASFVVAVIFQAFGIDPDNPVREGILFFTAGIMVGALVIWMMRQGRGAKAGIEDRLGGLVSGRRQGVLGSQAGVFLFVFFMVAREGVETVFFMLALGGESSGGPVNNLVGGAVGIALAAGFGFLLSRGTLRINLKRLFRVTGVVMLVLSLKLIASGIHEWTEAGILPGNGRWSELLEWLAQDSTSTVVLMALIGLPAMLIFWESRKIRPAAVDDTAHPDRRRQIARAGAARRWGMITSAVGFAIMLALAGTQIAGVL